MLERDIDILHNQLDAVLKAKPDIISKSPLDGIKYDNDDIELDSAVEKNGGRFFVCNANVLTAEW
jgi:hypothetical protein